MTARGRFQSAKLGKSYGHAHFGNAAYRTGKGSRPLTGVVGLILRAGAGLSLGLHHLENAVEILQRRVLDQDLAFAVAVGNGDPDARCPLQLLLGRVPQPFPRKFYCLGPFFDLFNWGAPPLSPGFGDRVGTIFTEALIRPANYGAK